MRYGMPYKGSKNLIAAEIISILPPAKHFYDIFGGDYRDLDFEDDAVIYADPPYRGTDQYGTEFDSDAFIAWAEEQKPPVYVSEADYIDRWDIVWSKQKRELMCIGGHKKRTEILYKVVKNEGSI